MLSPFIIAVGWLAGFWKKFRQNICDRQFFSETKKVRRFFYPDTILCISDMTPGFFLFFG